MLILKFKNPNKITFKCKLIDFLNQNKNLFYYINLYTNKNFNFKRRFNLLAITINPLNYQYLLLSHIREVLSLTQVEPKRIFQNSNRSQ